MPPLQENSLATLAPISREEPSEEAKVSPFFQRAAIKELSQHFQRARTHPMTMTCPKCSGLLVTEPSLDFYVQSDLWRCINCGASPTRASSPAERRGLVGARRGRYARTVASGWDMAAGVIATI